MRNTVNTTMVDNSTSPVGARRRGNVMLFVIFILGTLFAASMAFLALMRTEADVMTLRRSQAKLDVIFDGLGDEVVLGSVSELMGLGLATAGGNRVPYVQDPVDNDGPDGIPANAGSIDDDGIADRSDTLSSYATIPGVHPLVSSIEPYITSTGVWEWFSVSDLYRAWDDGVDVRIGPGGVIEAAVPLSSPLQIRPLDGSGATPPYNDNLTRHDAMSDADGDGVVDSRRYLIALLGGGVVDAGGNILASGTAYPQSLRRAIAAKLRDQDDDILDVLDDLYLSLRVIQNGGMANLNYSHRSLIDNLFGFDADGAPVAGKMMNLPYGPAVEQALRRRGVLAPLRWDDPLATLGPLGDDMLADNSREGPLYKTFFDALLGPQASPPEDLQWFPLLDEPGGKTPDEDRYDLDWAGRWMNPDSWNDLIDSAGMGNVDRNYDVPHIVTTASTDDMYMRNGKFGTGLLTSGLPPYIPATDGLDTLPVPYFQSGDSALDTYPAYDPNSNGPGTGDPSFIDPATGLPKVPLRLVMDPVFGYGRPRDANGTASSDSRYAGMQFALHSIGRINAPTQREIQTVQDYFTVMLRNVWDMDGDGVLKTVADVNEIDDQAARLTANFIDFADYDQGVGGMRDFPTEVLSRTGKVFYGFENQPFISEVYTDGEDNFAVELSNPYAADMINLNTMGYYLRVVDLERTHLGGPFLLTGTISGNGFSHFYQGADPAAGGIELPLPPIAAPKVEDRVQLLRRVPSPIGGGLVYIVVDEFTVDSDDVPPVGRSLQRDTNTAGRWRVVIPKSEEAPQKFGISNSVDLSAKGAPVHAITDSRGLESAYPTTGSLLLLMRYAQEGSFVAVQNASAQQAAPMTLKLASGSINRVDNGHMPVFDQNQLAQVGLNPVTGVPDGSQPMDGTTLLSIPWGQLVFDYFTALPFENQFDPLVAPPAVARPVEPGNPSELEGGWPIDDGIDNDNDGVIDDDGYVSYVAYLRANQPTVELGGVRVHGRININAAPWKVLQGAPLMPPGVLPIYKQFDPTLTVFSGSLGSWSNWDGFGLQDPAGNGAGYLGELSFTADAAGGRMEQLGAAKTKGIVAYRELRELPDPIPTWAGRTTGNYNTLMPNSFRYRSDGSTNPLASTTQRHTAGFLTVGELANVRLTRPSDATLVVTDGFSQMDNGQSYDFPGAGFQNYLFAVAPLVALGDWVTVKGHTFTAYGVLTGHGDVLKANPDDDVVLDRAERFEMVFDRSNLLLSNDPAERPEVIYKVREPLSEVNPN